MWLLLLLSNSRSIAKYFLNIFVNIMARKYFFFTFTITKAFQTPGSVQRVAIDFSEYFVLTHRVNTCINDKTKMIENILFNAAPWRLGARVGQLNAHDAVFIAFPEEPRLGRTVFLWVMHARLSAPSLWSRKS